MRETVDLPVAMLPVRPMRSMVKDTEAVVRERIELTFAGCGISMWRGCGEGRISKCCTSR